MVEPIPVQGLFETHLTVSNLQRSIKFYQDIVGLQLTLEANRLRLNRIRPLSFFGAETTEPSIIGWMPAAVIYFRDPDNHLIEYLAMLDHNPRPDLGIIPWSEWLSKS
jgi:lactoylglutathione lyase